MLGAGTWSTGMPVTCTVIKGMKMAALLRTMVNDHCNALVIDHTMTEKMRMIQDEEDEITSVLCCRCHRSVLSRLKSVDIVLS